MSNEQQADAFLSHFWQNYSKRLDRLNFLRHELGFYGTEDELADVFQLTVLKCATTIRARGLNHGSYYGTYFDTALRNNLLKQAKRHATQSKKKNAYIDALRHDGEDVVAPDEYELDGVPTDAALLRQWSEEAMRELPEKYSHVLRCVAEGLRYKDMARNLNLSLYAVKMRLVMARRVITALIKKKQERHERQESTTGGKPRQPERG